MSEAPLNCFPMRVDWEATLPVLTAEPFPVPVTHSREGFELAQRGCPQPVLKLATFAREHSWEVRTQYSRGHIPHATTGRPSVSKDIVGLRFGAHPITDRQAYAVYSRNTFGGTWTRSSIMVWGPDLPPFAGCGVTELKWYLEHADWDGLILRGWVDVVKSECAQREAARKARPKTPAKPREDHA